MTRWLRWLQRIAVALATAFVAVYAGDWTAYKLRGSPQSQVTVNRYVTIPLKGNRSEFDFLGSSAVPCSDSLFPQSGLSACWQLRRNPNQGLTR